MSETKTKKGKTETKTTRNAITVELDPRGHETLNHLCARYRISRDEVINYLLWECTYKSPTLTAYEVVHEEGEL